jgi:hypothetical protein
LSHKKQEVAHTPMTRPKHRVTYSDRTAVKREEHGR